MGRRLNYGGGQSSLGYLLGGGSGGEADSNTQPPPSAEIPSDDATIEESYNVINQNPNVVVHDNMTNNYPRPDGQNYGNYITNRPLTKVHAAPGGNSPKPSTVTTEESLQNPPESYNVINQNPNAVVHDNMTNNYHRPDGQNCGNYITNRPLTKVHAAPGSNSLKPSTVTTEESSQKPPESYNVINQNPNAVVHDNMTNNYQRPDGQNYGNYLTNRPLTKVHAAPGGNSSLDYLFKDDRK